MVKTYSVKKVCEKTLQARKEGLFMHASQKKIIDPIYSIICYVKFILCITSVGNVVGEIMEFP